MSGWFWSLRGFDLFLATLGIIAAGLGTVLLGGVALAKLVTGAMEHDWRTCPHGCKECQFKRNQSFTRSREKSSHQFREPTETKDHYISTARLDFGMRVRLNGVPYRVRRIHTDHMGYLIELINLRTRMSVVATIAFERADMKYWEPLHSWQ